MQSSKMSWNSQISFKDIDEVTTDVTAGQNKMSKQKIAQQYACTPAGPLL